MKTPISALLERKGPIVHAVTPTMTVAEAVAEMNRHCVGCVVVLDGVRLCGIFTERDVLRRVVGASLDPKGTRVAAVMTDQIITITPEVTVEDALLVFTERRCRHLPVVRQGRMIGLLSSGDVSRWMSDVHRSEAEHLKNYIAGGLAV
jgi:CBS domain-containing protein